MRHRVLLGAGLAVALLTGYAVSEEALKSGPQVGDSLPGPFNVLNACNAELPQQAGKKSCLVWQHGAKSVALIFTREINDPLTSLVKKLDAEVAKSDRKMGAFVVLLTDQEEEEAAEELKSFGEKANIKNVSLTVGDVTGPPRYKVAKDAAVTVVYYSKRKIEANHAFRAGKFGAKEAEAVAADLEKIAPAG